MKFAAPALAALLVATPIFAAPPEQVAGWTVSTLQNPKEKEDFSVLMKRTAGSATLTYKLSNLSSETLVVRVGNCTSSGGFSLYGDDGNPLPRLPTVKKGMADHLKDMGSGCEMSAATSAQLLTGLDQALAAADARFKAERPKPDLTPKTAGAGGWAFRDTPVTGPDGSILERTLSMSRTVGGIKLNYEISVGISEYSSSPTRSIKASFNDCNYDDSGDSDFLDAGRRARDIQAKIKTNMPSSFYGCELTDAGMAALLVGFEPAYLMLEKWMIDRVDERKLLLQAANEFANSAEETP